jgi:hypothetical protein
MDTSARSAVPDRVSPELSPERFGSAFKAFVHAVDPAASTPASPLLERIRAHLGTDPAQLPVVGEEFDSFEHPNVQVARDDYLSHPGRTADLVDAAAGRMLVAEAWNERHRPDIRGTADPHRRRDIRGGRRGAPMGAGDLGAALGLS